MDKEQLLYHFFSNKLSPEQEQEFNELLATDSEFKAQYDFEQDLKQVIRNKETVDLKGKLAGFEKEISKDTPVRTLPNTNYRKWAMAASIALLVGLGWFGYNNFAGPNYGNLYDENFQQYPNTSYTITRGDTDDSIERQAFVAYETGNFQTAIDNFNKLDTNEKTYLHFYKAQSYLKLDKSDEAKTLFKKVITNNSQFVAESHWYLALIAVKDKDKENAISYLKQLISKYDFNKEKARGLIKKLD